MRSNSLYRDTLESEGLTVIEISHRGSGHVGYRVRWHGHETTFIGSHTTGDQRAIKNFRSYVRRWKAEKKREH
jgi:hypothetical protein